MTESGRSTRSSRRSIRSKAILDAQLSRHFAEEVLQEVKNEDAAGMFDEGGSYDMFSNSKPKPKKKNRKGRKGKTNFVDEAVEPQLQNLDELLQNIARSKKGNYDESNTDSVAVTRKRNYEESGVDSDHEKPDFSITIAYGGVKIGENYYASYSRGKQSITTQDNKGRTFAVNPLDSGESLTHQIGEQITLEPFYIKFDPTVHIVRLITIEAEKTRKYGTINLCQEIPVDGITGDRDFVVMKKIENDTIDALGPPQARDYQDEHEREVPKSLLLFRFYV